MSRFTFFHILKLLESNDVKEIMSSSVTNPVNFGPRIIHDEKDFNCNKKIDAGYPPLITGQPWPGPRFGVNLIIENITGDV